MHQVLPFCYGNKIGPKTVETEEKVGKRGFSLYTTFRRHCTNKMRRLAALISQKYLRNLQNPKSLKITEKVSFNIASEASYFYILSGQKLIKSAKNVVFWQVFDNYKLAVKEYYQRILMGQKLVENVELKNSN